MIKFAYLNLNKYKMQNPPTLLTQIRTFFKALFIHIKTGSKTVGGKVYMKRLDTCSMCQFKRGDKCGKCGCLLIPKAKWKTSTCPIDKW
tara:strand:+ start:938 stop:1204 length:267 start_codon:yes stop_codon:yes gene_type:complete